MSWTQPICYPCFDDRNPRRHPVRVRDADTETCCYCGRPTHDGIYVRVDPATVPHPREEPA